MMVALLKSKLFIISFIIIKLCYVNTNNRIQRKLFNQNNEYLINQSIAKIYSCIVHYKYKAYEHHLRYLFNILHIF